jgi:hypothetical protein
MKGLANISKIVYRSTAIAFLIILSISLFLIFPNIANAPIGLIFVFFLLLFLLLTPLAAVFTPPKILYYIKLGTVFLGTGLIIIFWLNLYGMGNMPYSFLSLSGIPIVVLLHVFTRKGFAIHREYLYGGLGLDLRRITRILSIPVEPFLLFAAIFVSIPDYIKLPTFGSLTVFIALFGIYVAFSLQGLNAAYRAMLLDSLLSRQKSLRLSAIERSLVAKYPTEPDSIGFISFILKSSMDNFVLGDYERCFFDCYRIINDPIIVNNKLSVDPIPITKKHANAKVLDEYRKIRVFLAHGYLQQRKTGTQQSQTSISIQDVVWAKKMLFGKTLDLIQLSFMVASQL